ncbi:MAG: phosphoglucosamine mutase [Candidatus Aminicenantes bacterium]|nr:phosphoglucosamine mutase [Candidatus Aminicenantes bacterium]
MREFNRRGNQGKDRNLRTSDLKISISGIRGIVGQSLTPQLILKFSEAFSSFIGEGEIGVATDTRPSGSMLKYAVFSGLLSCGAIPVDMGILPIPSLQVYVKSKHLRGGISITASHNPVEWNALKLIKNGGFFLSPYEAEELLDYYYQGRFKRVAQSGIIKKEGHPFQIHETKILDFIQGDLIANKQLKVIVDPCGGAASPYVKSFLEQLGVEVKCINCGLSNGFPRNPEPLPQNITALSESVKKHGADIGFAQDADADRLAVVDEKGSPIGEEYTLALAIQYYLNHKQKTPVVINLSTSRVIQDISEKAGVELIRTKVGEINVSKKMLDTGSKIGGEGNGGIIAADIHACRDSFVGMALILEYLAVSGKKTSQLKSALPYYKMIKDKIKANFNDRKRILHLIQAKFDQGQTNTEDGLKVEYPDFWLHVRPSNTEPVMRIIIEGKNDRLVESIYSEIKECL